MERIYGLNAEDRIVLTAGEWDARARESEAQAALSRNVLYKPILDFVQGDEVREHLSGILRRCRDRRVSHTALMRCDGPRVGMLTRMTVEPSIYGMLIVRHKTLRLVALPDMAEGAPAGRDCDGRCSLCNALRFGGTWVPSFSRPFDPDRRPDYVICPECRRTNSPREHAFMLAGFDDLRRMAG